MAEAEAAIIAHLLSTSAVTTLVGQRIYYRRTAQAPALPFCVLWRVSSPRVHSLAGGTGLVRALLQLDTFATSGLAARGVANAVRGALDGLRQEVNGVSLQAVLLHDEFDSYEESLEYSRIIQEYRVWYQE